jgi:hypothetical protein
MKKSKLKGFFDLPEWWEEHWQGMPEFIQGDLSPYQSIVVCFKNEKDFKEFSNLVNQNIIKTKFIWYPKKEKVKRKSKMYIDES